MLIEPQKREELNINKYGLWYWQKIKSSKTIKMNNIIKVEI